MGIRYYRTKQLYVEAIQYTKENEDEIIKRFGSVPVGTSLEDWIVVTNDTELSVMTPTTFWKKYEVII